ncbi:related to nucleoside-diphosphate-sugar epimerases [Fusarium mangiferae]|uniref:Related to nucleoside-diphosphate-sugar epimerases n=1 Tax=Fusarium mangiferae TaxID=192010 RepID=A0A1L7THT0_FUSMA|nr:related to nucleoside-diphosphate-sugar epimerases [Fusarium mangiferae]CVK94821.1 related to nucleoside-diphosphate-sugar epimerases [Fusarium mangiferae]
MSRNILVTGATGKQGGAVVQALLNRYPSKFTILAVTRNAQSPTALRLAQKSSSVKVVEGDLDNVSSLFKATEKVASGPIWGVFSVQAVVGNGATSETELRQGKGLIDESIKHNVRQFVYSSVDRGGNDYSWNNPTNIPHFQVKNQIEKYLRDQTANGKNSMGWTILRPVIFFDNIAPGFEAKVFMTSYRDVMKDKPLQWIATSDIGVFAAEVFNDHERFAKKAIGIAGEELTFSDMNLVFKQVTGHGIGTTFRVLGKALKAGVKEVGTMLDCFKAEGYNADIQLAKSIHPNVKGFREWLKQDSAFTQR